MKFESEEKEGQTELLGASWAQNRNIAYSYCIDHEAYDMKLTRVSTPDKGKLRSNRVRLGTTLRRPITAECPGGVGSQLQTQFKNKQTAEPVFRQAP